MTRGGSLVEVAARRGGRGERGGQDGVSSGTVGRVVSCGRADCGADIAAAEAVTGP